MKTDSGADNDFFSVESISDVVIIKIIGNPLYQLIDLQAKATLFDCMEEINNRDDTRVMVILGPAEKTDYEGYINFFRCRSGHRKALYEKEDITCLTDLDTLARFCNAVNQLVLKFVSSSKFVIHADSGLILSPFMNLSLACDYRIVGKNSFYKNPYLELGLIPKGGSAFFLTRLVGYRNALKVLLADKPISAEESLKLGLVDQVVPTGEIYAAALETAHRYADLPPSSLSGIKSLMNCATADLKCCLKREDELFTRIINSNAFIDKIAAGQAAGM